MSPEHEHELRARYPSYARYVATGGAARCGDGWFALLDAFLAEIDGPTVSITGVKQKLGLLRVGVEGLSGVAWSRLLELERASGAVCELCGAAGRRRQGRPIMTRCDAHASPA